MPGLLSREPGKSFRVDGVSPGRPQSFRYQHRPVDDCSPGQGGMAQDGETRGGTFHGEMDHCTESKDKRARAGSLAIVD